MAESMLENKREEMRKILNEECNFNNPESVKELNRRIFEIQKEMYES